MWYVPRCNIFCHCSLKTFDICMLQNPFSVGKELSDPSLGCQPTNPVHTNSLLITQNNINSLNGKLSLANGDKDMLRHVQQMSENGIWRVLGVILYSSEHHSTSSQISAATSCLRRAVGMNPRSLATFLRKVSSNSWMRYGSTGWPVKINCQSSMMK